MQLIASKLYVSITDLNLSALHRIAGRGISQREMGGERKLGGKEQVRDKGREKNQRRCRAGTEGHRAARKMSNSASVIFFCQAIFVAWAAHKPLNNIIDNYFTYQIIRCYH